MNESVGTIAQRIQSGLRKLPNDKAVEVLDFVEFLALRHARTEPPGSHRATIEPDDMLMDDHDTLRALYAAFAREDQELAQSGLAHYAQVLREEESAYEAR